MSEYTKTELNLRKAARTNHGFLYTLRSLKSNCACKSKKRSKSKKKRGRGQIMSEYNKTELNLRKDQKVKKRGEGSNYVGI